MSAQCKVTAKRAVQAPLNTFERYLSLWVFLCIVAGIALGQILPGLFQAIARLGFAQVNLPVGFLIWVMKTARCCWFLVPGRAAGACRCSCRRRRTDPPGLR